MSATIRDLIVRLHRAGWLPTDISRTVQYPLHDVTCVLRGAL